MSNPAPSYDLGCLRCGKCCGADPTTVGDGYLGGDETTDADLRLPTGECRHLLPADDRGERLCAVHGTTQQPQFCRLYPFINPLIHAGCAFENDHA